MKKMVVMVLLMAPLLIANCLVLVQVLKVLQPLQPHCSKVQTTHQPDKKPIRTTHAQRQHRARLALIEKYQRGEPVVWTCSEYGKYGEPKPAKYGVLIQVGPNRLREWAHPGLNVSEEDAALVKAAGVQWWWNWTEAVINW